MPDMNAERKHGMKRLRASLTELRRNLSDFVSPGDDAAHRRYVRRAIRAMGVSVGVLSRLSGAIALNDLQAPTPFCKDGGNHYSLYANVIGRSCALPDGHP